MKNMKFLPVVTVIVLLAANVTAATLFVDLNCTNPVSPYTNWVTAATNIQDAIDATSDGDTVVVTNGVYQTGGRIMAANLTNRVALYKAVTVQSVNGPWVTTIQGSHTGNGNSAVRCAWLTNNATLSGFTLKWGATGTSGDTSGGGVWCASSNVVVANCIIVSNTASLYGGGAYQGTLINCLISSNSTSGAGGSGACNAVLNNCTVISNANYGIYQTLPNLVRAMNCIIFFNGQNNYGGLTATFNHCCTTPLVAGSGNFATDPGLFVDGVHLTSTSPCIGTGTNVAVGTDIFGNAWANPPSIGCAEWEPEPAVTSPKIQLTGDPVGFTIGGAVAVGQPPFTFSWVKDGVPLQDNGHFTSTQTSNLVVAGVSFADAGNYQLVVSNSFGVVTSAVAQLVIHYVDINGINPVAPYSTWATAATNIQDAITAAAAGDAVFVTNGLYASGGKSMDGVITNRVLVDKAILVQSVNGYKNTIIQGTWDPATTNGPDAVRCAYVADGAVLNGFTLQNGATLATGDGYSGGPLESGGGVWCNSPNGVVSDCLLTNNSAIYGGSMAYGTLNNSLVIGNYATYGGGAYYSTLNNCTVVNNYNPTSVLHRGAGTYAGSVANSIVLGNYDLGSILISAEDDYAGVGQIMYSYSCTSLPNGPPLTGTGNIFNANPEFLDAFHISSLSPAAAPAAPPTPAAMIWMTNHGTTRLRWAATKWWFQIWSGRCLSIYSVLKPTCWSARQPISPIHHATISFKAASMAVRHTLSGRLVMDQPLPTMAKAPLIFGPIRVITPSASPLTTTTTPLAFPRTPSFTLCRWKLRSCSRPCC